MIWCIFGQVGERVKRTRAGRGFQSLQSILPPLPRSKTRPGFPNAAPADILEAAWLRLSSELWEGSGTGAGTVKRAESGAVITGDPWFDAMEEKLFQSGGSD